MWLTQPFLLFALIGSSTALGPAPTVSPSATVQAKIPAPSGCKKLSSDSDWPADEIWKAEFPGIEPREPNQKLKHPDWSYEARTVEQVQKAVRFAAKHDVRLSIFNTGHGKLNSRTKHSALHISIRTNSLTKWTDFMNRQVSFIHSYAD
jgi:hypothetical protein